MKKIAIICPYFGNFPKNINITIQSMNNNQFIDWYIFTDNNEMCKNKKYNNIFFIPYTFEELKKNIKEKIGTDVFSIYKLCDYKPTYGYIFEELLKKYEFWGYCDVDAIFGDLAMFFTNERLNRYDKIYDLGHLSIYRNIKELREAFMGNNIVYVPYKKILNAKYIYVFDEPYSKEHQNINSIIKKMGYHIYNERNEFADIDIKYNNFYPHHRKKEKYYYFLYNSKKMYLMKTSDHKFQEEISYVHLQQKKQLPIYYENIEDLIITPKGFFEKNVSIKELFYKKNDFKLLWYLKYRIEKKISKIIGKIKSN